MKKGIIASVVGIVAGVGLIKLSGIALMNQDKGDVIDSNDIIDEMDDLSDVVEGTPDEVPETGDVVSTELEQESEDKE